MFKYFALCIFIYFTGKLGKNAHKEKMFFFVFFFFFSAHRFKGHMYHRRFTVN